MIVNNSSSIKSLLTVVTFCFSVVAFSQAPLHLYGGKNHEVYLGCLNCSSTDNNSIWNIYGDYGSAYNSKCIWNSYSEYGNAYSDYSPFNSYASHPPVVVDKAGNFYGYFTINAYADKRVTFSLAITIYKFYSSIRSDVSGWYDKIFK